MPPSSFTYSGVNFEFPSYKSTGNDNVVMQGQEITVPRGRYLSFVMLAAAESGMGSGTIRANYADGSSSQASVLVPAWWNWPYPAGGDLVFSHYLTVTSANFNRSNIFQTANWLDSSKELVSLTFPNSTGGSSTAPGGAAVEDRLHVFSLSMLPAPEQSASAGAELEIQYARSTQKWMDGPDKIQIVEVIVNNVGSEFVLRNNSVRLNVRSPGMDTVVEGVIKRLGPGDQTTVQIGVKPKQVEGLVNSGPATVTISGDGIRTAAYTFNATYGIQPYQATYESIYSHESPDWYNNAKYGIFIHWGVYSVPGWGNQGNRESYAEWSVSPATKANIIADEDCLGTGGT